jgi:hypothetical protein
MVLLAAMVLAASASGQPSNLDKCMSWGEPWWPNCGSTGIGFYDTCSSSFIVTYVAWYPLKYVGPIDIEVKTTGAFAFSLPLYIQIAPLPDSTGTGVCELDYYPRIPGYIVGVAGGVDVCGGGWETFGPIDLQEILPIGGAYALQLRGFVSGINVSSPAVDCVRVTPVVTMTATATTSWGQVKSLFK